MTASLEKVGSVWRFKDEEDTVHEFDSNGRLVSITLRSGLNKTLQYYSSGYQAGRLQSVTDFVGRQLVFDYDTSVRISSITDPDGKQILYSYNPDGYLASVKFQDNAIRQYVYNELQFTSNVSGPWLLTGIIDESGSRFATFEYLADAERKSKATYHAGGAQKYEFSSYTADTTDVTAHVSASPVLSATRTYAFSTSLGVKRLTGITGPACPSCGPAASTYDSNGFLASSTDWNGTKTCYTHNARGLEEVRVEALPSSAQCPYTGAFTGVIRRITTEWHASYRLPTKIAEPLRLTTLTYGAANDPNPGNRGSLLQRTIQATSDASGSQGTGVTPVGTARTWTYAYNANGQVLTENGPRTDVSDIATAAYYANNATCTATLPGASTTGCRGQLNTTTNALNHLTTINEYNAHGQPLKITDPNGLEVILSYDARQRISSRNLGGESTTYEHHPTGHLKKVTQLDGSFLQYSYDAAQRLTEVADSLGNRISYKLDLAGNRIQECVFATGTSGACGDQSAQPVQNLAREYSNLNRLAKLIGGSNPQAQVTEYTLYDGNGNLQTIKYPLDDPDPLGNEREFGYDALNRLIATTDPKVSGVRALTQYAYDGIDQLVSVTDPRNLITSYSLSGLGNLTQLASPDAGTTIFRSYDAAGNLLSQTDAKTQVTTYTYDALNRVASIIYQGNVTHSYQYDQGANGKGRLTRIIEPNSTTLLAYDQKGRLASDTRTINAVTYVTAYQYDGFGRLSGIAYPGGRQIEYSFDPLGRVSGITTSKGGSPQTVVSSVAYQPFGSAKSFTFGNGQVYTRAIDQDGRVASFTLGAQTTAVCYDAASRIVGLSGNCTPPFAQTYGYDNLDRLTNAALSSGSFGFTYDAVGNRLTKSVGAATDSYLYGTTNNRLATLTPASEPVRSFIFDLNGSTTNNAINQFGYDTRGRMNQAISAVGTTTYQVNSVGQRIRKMNAQGDTIYHYDAQGRLIAESSPGGILHTEYVYLGDIPVAIIR